VSAITVAAQLKVVEAGGKDRSLSELSELDFLSQGIISGAVAAWTGTVVSQLFNDLQELQNDEGHQIIHFDTGHLHRKR